MLIVWDYFGVIAQDSFWYTAERIATGSGMSKDMQLAHTKADLGQISWDEYTKKVSKDISIPLDEVRARYLQHNIKQSTVLAIRSLPEHTHALLSNASSGYLLPVMEHLGLDDLFDRVFVSSDIGLVKPDPKAFEYVLDKMSFSPKESVMVDDSKRNIEVATSLGMNTIHFNESLDLISEFIKLGIK